jgi:hypothetical protein
VLVYGWTGLAGSGNGAGWWMARCGRSPAARLTRLGPALRPLQDRYGFRTVPFQLFLYEVRCGCRAPCRSRHLCAAPSHDLLRPSPCSAPHVALLADPLPRRSLHATQGKLVHASNAVRTEEELYTAALAALQRGRRREFLPDGWRLSPGQDNSVLDYIKPHTVLREL